MKDDLPEVSCALKPVQGYKPGSGTTGFVCLLAVLGIELGLPNAKHVGYTYRTLFLGFKGISAIAVQRAGRTDMELRV